MLLNHLCNTPKITRYLYRPYSTYPSPLSHTFVCTYSFILSPKNTHIPSHRLFCTVFLQAYHAYSIGPFPPLQQSHSHTPLLNCHTHLFSMVYVGLYYTGTQPPPSDHSLVPHHTPHHTPRLLNPSTTQHPFHNTTHDHPTVVVLKHKFICIG